MMIKRKITMDLASPGYAAVVGGVQNDRYTRALEITLTDAGDSWNVPEDVKVLVGYSRPDGSGGQYDTLPNGERAWSAEGNVLTVILAPQTMAVPGPVRIWVTLLREQMQLSTFAVVLNVHAASGTGAGKEEGYTNVTGFLPGVTGAEAGQFLRVTEVTESGLVTAVEAVDLGDSALLPEAQTLSDVQKSVSRKNIGALGEDMTAQILPLQTLAFAYDEQFAQTLWHAEPAPFVLVEGETYKVIWEGETFECTAVSAEALEPGMVLLGNGVVFGLGDSGEAFLFAYVPGRDMCFCMTKEDLTAPFCQAEIRRVVLPQVLPAAAEEDEGMILQIVGGAWEKAANPLPVATDAMEGQFLRVAGGKWCAVTVANAEGVSF